MTAKDTTTQDYYAPPEAPPGAAPGTPPGAAPGTPPETPPGTPAPPAPVVSTAPAPPAPPAPSTATRPRTGSAGRRTHWSARQLATMALFVALSALFAFIPLPLFPPATMFGITYDPANVPAALGGFAYGPGAGCLIGILGQAIHGLLAGDYIGALMNIVAVCAFVLPAALICRRSRTIPRLITGLIVGGLASVAVIIPANLVIWPQFYGIPLEATLTYVVPLMLPFNLLKALLNSVLSFLLYQSLHRFLEPVAKGE